MFTGPCFIIIVRRKLVPPAWVTASTGGPAFWRKVILMHDQDRTLGIADGPFGDAAHQEPA